MLKYVLLGKLGAEWITRHDERVEQVMRKFDELGISLETVYYTQGSIDFIDIVEVPDAESLLAFSTWYLGQGMGSVESLPAFDNDVLARACARA